MAGVELQPVGRAVEAGGTGGNNLSWRVATLEREVNELKKGKPDVVAERVDRLSRDVADLRTHLDGELREMRDAIEKGDKENADGLEAQRRILIGAWITLATGLILAYVLGGGAGVV